MSLYEQFHSDINKNYMFDMIKDIILKEMSNNILFNTIITKKGMFIKNESFKNSVA